MANQEIERRFLVTKTRGHDAVHVPTLEDLARKIVGIKQGYFEVRDPDTSFRVRITEDLAGNVIAAFITVKTGEGLVRSEFEVELPDHKFAQLLFEKSHHRISKQRYYIGDWEVDVFDGSLRGIVFAEKEMASPDEPLNIPYFIEEYKEITDYLTNLHLARLATELKGLGVPAMPFLSERFLRSIPCIALVGGPGAGKTGIISILKGEFSDIHFVPEAAEIVIGRLGISPSSDPFLNRRFQKAIYNTTRTFRATSTEFAITHDKTALVFDRPEADGAAYCDSVSEFETINHTTLEAELDKIKIAIYLELPPREIYEEHKKNNPTRSETYEEAVAREEKTKAIWQRHHNFHLVGNEGSWEAKVNKVRQLIRSTIKT